MNSRTLRFTIVNLTSASRIVLSAIFLFLYLDADPVLQCWSLLVIALAVITDFIDGALARRWKVATKFGYLLDGITDRAAYVAVILAISWRDGFPLLLGYAIIVRDFVLYGGRSYFPRWIERLPLQRRVAHFHAGAVRGILGVYLVSTGYTLLSEELPVLLRQIRSMMPALAALLTIASYVSLGLMWKEQITLHRQSPLDELDE